MYKPMKKNIFLRKFLICFKLLKDSALDRILRLEANTIPGNFLLLIAFHFSALDFVMRMAVTLIANLLIYFINDYIDIEVDLANKDKDHSKALFLKKHQKDALALILYLSTALIVATMFYSTSVCLAVVLVLFFEIIYTDSLKKKPFWDILLVGLISAALSWIAMPDFSWQGTQLVLLLFIFGCAFETVQTLKDYKEDKEFGITTTPVVIGIPSTVLILRGLYIISMAYAVFVLHELAGILLCILLFFSTSQNMSRYWTKLKMVCGIVWVIIMVRLFLQYNA